jgi:hypothetical protein
VTPGTHLLLLELERDDGLLEYDLAVVEAVPEAPLVSSASWADTWFVPIVGAGTVAFTLTPGQDGMNGYAALAGRRLVNAHEDNAVIVRANTEGFFDARNADAYESERPIAYRAGTSYRIGIDVDVAGGTYGVTVDGELLAEGYAFRREETMLGQLTAWDAAGSLAVEDITVEGDLAVPDPACIDEPEAEEEETGDEPAADMIDPRPDDMSDPRPDAGVDAIGEEGGETPPAAASGGCGCAVA